MHRHLNKGRITSNKLKLVFYMADKGIKIREPNTLIEAGQKLSKEELIIWMWSLLKAKPRGLKDENLKKEDIERYKKAQKLPLMVSIINLEELEKLFPEYFKNRKIKYYKELLQKMEKKIGFEVKLNDYLKVLKELGYEFVIKELDIPTETQKVKYYGISIILSVALFEDYSLKIVFSPYVTPLLLELKAWYTTYDFLEILNLHSKHSIILYRLIKEKLGLRKNPFTIPFEELQKIFDVNYKTWANFKTFVIKPAVEDVNQNTRYVVEFKTIRRGKGGKVSEITFFVKEKKFLSHSDFLDLKPLLETLIISFHQGGEDITEEEFAQVLLSLQRVNPAVAMWFLLHYPEGEPRLYAWKHIEMTEKNPTIKDPDRFLISLIKDKDESLDWLLDQRTKDLIRKELEKIVQPKGGEEKPFQTSNPLLEKIHSLWEKFPPEGKEKVLKAYKVQSLKELIDKEGLEGTWGILKTYFRVV